MAYKVLLADDSVPAQNMGKKILIEAGYDVLTVSNGLEALRKIADTLPDIVILDIFMPGYTGLEICARLRSKAATAELPVILTVGKLEPYRPEDGEQVRSNAVIVKPFAAAELTAAVRSLIGVQRAEVVFSAENPPPANVADPLAEDLAASDEKPLSELLTGMPVEAADEPMFASAPSVTAVESPRIEEPGPETLVFNPDAARTPFSASVAEAPLAELDAPAEAEPPAITEFHLEFETPAQDSAESFSEGAPVESWPAEPEAAAPFATPAFTHHATHEATHDQAVADTAMADPEPATLASEPAVADEPAISIIHESAESEGPLAFEEVAGVAASVAEPDSSLREGLVLEPLVEAPEELAQTGVMASDTDAGLPELILLDDAAADGEDSMTAMDEPLTPEQEARRQAFEDLFNSDVPFPLEEAPGSVYQAEPFAPPCLEQSSLPESPAQEVGEIETEPEIATDDFLDAFVSSAAEPEAVEAVEPPPASDPLFAGEPQREDISASSVSSLEIEPPPVAESSSVLGDSYTVRPDVISEPMPQFQTKVPANGPETPAAAAPAEAAPVEKTHPAPVASPERSELVAEVAKVEALLVQMQAVRQVGEPARHAPGVTEFPQPEAAPSYLQSSWPTSASSPSTQMWGAEEVESAPLQATEDAPIELAAAPAPVEAELPEAEAAPVQHEQELEPELVSVPLETTPEELAHARAEAVEEEPAFAPAPEDGLNDAERIHKAVERVFDRFRPLLVAAIVRELVRRD